MWNLLWIIPLAWMFAAALNSVAADPEEDEDTKQYSGLLEDD